MVNFGNSDLEMGNVSVVVDMGDFSQSLKELWMRTLAVKNPAKTTIIQKSLMRGVLMLAM